MRWPTRGYLGSLAVDLIECASTLRKRVEFFRVRAAAHAVACDLFGAAAFFPCCCIARLKSDAMRNDTLRHATTRKARSGPFVPLVQRVVVSCRVVGRLY